MSKCINCGKEVREDAVEILIAGGVSHFSCAYPNWKPKSPESGSDRDEY